MKLDKNMFREITREIMMGEEDGDDEKKEKKTDSPQPPAGGEGGPIKLKIDIPDTPFEDEEDEKIKEITEAEVRRIVRNSIFGNLKKRVDEINIKFNTEKVQNLIKKDKFLQQAFKVLSGDTKSKTIKVFNNFVVGDKNMEQLYLKENLYGNK